MTFQRPIMSDQHGSTKTRYLCLTICGYRKQGMSEEDYRNHMVYVSAPLTKDLMVKYGVKRWTQIHNQSATRALMSQLYDPQMCNIADFDCFSQVVFESLEDYKRMKQDPWYKEHLIGDHEKFADTKRSQMTIGWIEEFVRDGEVVDGFRAKPAPEQNNKYYYAILAGLIALGGLGWRSISRRD
ncbi:EthD domain-containing protein [Leptodontidium sp. MPI-SDFR-AT-0119]|nr:EthD domain-containing protein [Leptodontidium sp. MPI-SDFR-AT-0119]